MPSIPGHFLVGASIALPFTASDAVMSRVRSGGLILVAGLLAAAPDLDAVFLGVIPYGHFFGHRGFFYSPAFAMLLSVSLSSAVFAVARSFTAGAWLTLSVVLFLSTASHGVLDSMTDAGLGVMLLYPGSERRIFLSWRPFCAPPPRGGRPIGRGDPPDSEVRAPVHIGMCRHGNAAARRSHASAIETASPQRSGKRTSARAGLARDPDVDAAPALAVGAHQETDLSELTPVKRGRIIISAEGARGRC